MSINSDLIATIMQYFAEILEMPLYDVASSKATVHGSRFKLISLRR